MPTNPLDDVVSFAATPADGTLAVNEPVTLAVAVPGTVRIPPGEVPVATAQTWTVTDDDAPPGEAYTILAGGLTQSAVTLQFVSGTAARTVTITIAGTVAAGTYETSFSRTFTYTVAAVDASLPVPVPLVGPPLNELLGYATTATGTVPNGAPVTLVVAAPPAVPIATGLVPVAVTQRWTLDPSDSDSYVVVAGGFDQPAVTLVFVPGAQQRTVTVTVTGTIAAAGNREPFQASFAYDVEPLNAAALKTLAEAAVPGLLAPVTTATVVPAGLFTLGLSALPPPEQAGTVVEIARSAPQVEIRGAIALGEVVTALLKPFALLGAAVDFVTSPLGGGAGDLVDTATGAVTQYLNEALTVPIAVDHRALDVVRRTLPDVTAPQPFADLTAAGGPLVGVPVGAWLPALRITKVSWRFEGIAPPVAVPVARGVAAAGLAQTFLVLPRWGVAEPRTATVSATVTVELGPPGQPALFSAGVDLRLPLALLLPSIPLPALGVVTTWNATGADDDKRARRYAVVSMPVAANVDVTSLDDALAAIESLRALLASLNRAITTARAAGADVATPREVTALTAVTSTLARTLASAPDAVGHFYVAVDNSFPKRELLPAATWYRANLNDLETGFQFIEDDIRATFFVGTNLLKYVGLGDGDGDDQEEDPRVWATGGAPAWAVLRDEENRYTWEPYAVPLYHAAGTELPKLSTELEALLFGA